MYNLSSFFSLCSRYGILTEGDNFANAIKMTRDAIEAAGISMEDNKEKLPVPSSQEAVIEKIKQYNMDGIDFLKGILTYVDVDFSEYRRFP